MAIRDSPSAGASSALVSCIPGLGHVRRAL